MKANPVQKIALDSTRWASWGESLCHKRALESATDTAEVWEAEDSLSSVFRSKRRNEENRKEE